MSVQAYSKLFGCRVHGFIRVYPMALKIINTCEFQRLREIKQLGLCYLVYPCATHTRYEHSLGVYHLSGLILDKIKKLCGNSTFYIHEYNREMQLTDHLMECIKLAALCHDIGHGPFSHVFDNVLLHDSNHANRHHETRSALIFEILAKRELANELNDNDIAFVKSIIKPGPNNTGALYQIVCNYLNGIDVDKFDYLARDCACLGLKTSFDHNRLIDEIIVDNKNNIAYPKHCSLNVDELFQSRYLMHKKVYSHKTVKLLECMLIDIFKLVDPIFMISDSINDMNKFCKLTDNTIFNYLDIAANPPQFIDCKPHPMLLQAYNIYQMIVTRHLYKQIVEIKDSVIGQSDLLLVNFINHICGKHANVDAHDLAIIATKINFGGSGQKNPFKNVFFYDKKENLNTFVLNSSNFSSALANISQQNILHLVCKKAEIFELVFAEWNIYLNTALK